MEEMVEPDRTIMIVSIIGLVVNWGSVAYHKFVQGGGPPRPEVDLDEREPAEGDADDAAPVQTTQPTAPGPKRRKGKKRPKR